MTSGKAAIVAAAAGRGAGFIDSLPHGGDRAAKVPMRRTGTVAETARTAAFLLGDGAGYVTGCATGYGTGDGDGYVTGRHLRGDGGLARGA